MNVNLVETNVEPEGQRTKGEMTRDAIKFAARRAIAVNGFSGVKVADIMNTAGKSPGAFYLYFKSKEALLHELLSDFQAKLLAEVNAPPAQHKDLTAHLLERVRAFWRIYREDWPIATAAFQMSMADPQFARAWHNIRQQGIRGFAAVVRKAQARGAAVGLDAELVASAVTSMIEYASYNWTARGGDFPDRVIDDKTATDVLSLLIVKMISD